MNSKLLEGLNPSQKKAVETIEGTVQICSVAGSGKTRVLTHRVAYMLEQGIKPNTILVTTFTKKAAEEMTQRLSKLITKMQLTQLTIGTSHSIGYKILAKEYQNIGHPLASAFKQQILINGTHKIFIKDVKKNLMYDRSIPFEVKEELRELAPAQLSKIIGLNKNQDIDCYQFQAMNTGKGPRMEAYCEFYRKYEEMKLAQRKVDADDLLFLLVRLFREHKDILAKYQRFYKYIMCDESQDCNALQYNLLKMLGAPEYNLFYVGDDDQSMYGFRGAKPGEFIHLKDNLRNVQQISLENNYRSNPHILEVANSLISNNMERLIKRLIPNKKDSSECVNYASYEDEVGEATGTVKEIQILSEQEGVNLKDIAVLYRTNAQSKSMEDQLIIAGLPYVIHGGISFYERKEVKDIVAYLQMASDTSNFKAMKRIINTPTRYLGKAFLEKVASIKGNSYDALDKISLKNYEQTGVNDFRTHIETLREMIDGDPVDMLDYIMNEVGYQKHLVGEDGEEEDEGNSRLENIETLRYAMQRFDNLKGFLAYIDLMMSTAKSSIDGVQLMTIHKSKGLEYPVVFVAGASEGILPHFQAVKAVKENKNPLAVEEERRLMYVAVTRAESRCYVSSINSFNGRGSFPSRFINEMGLVKEPMVESVAIETVEEIGDDEDVLAILHGKDTMR